MTKVCSRCKKEKDVILFSKNKKKSDGLNTFCKECQKQYQQEWYNTNKEKHKTNTLQTKQKNQQWWSKYKSTLKCEKCGESHPATLDFHHLDPKEKDAQVSDLINSRHKLLKEIEKCIVVCANCHRKIHYNMQA